MNKRKVGSKYEDVAVNYLIRNDVRIIDRNFRSRFGEIDIIGYKDGYYIFLEVKYRKDSHSGNPIEAVDYKKQCKICRVSDYYRVLHKLGDDTNVRFDVIAVLGNEIEWYKNAFEYK